MEKCLKSKPIRRFKQGHWFS